MRERIGTDVAATKTGREFHLLCYSELCNAQFTELYPKKNSCCEAAASRVPGSEAPGEFSSCPLVLAQVARMSYISRCRVEPYIVC